jgi:pyruvate dehydrogenase (quinone)
MPVDFGKLHTRRDVLQLSGAIGGTLLASSGLVTPNYALDRNAEMPISTPGDSQSSTADILIETLIRWEVRFVFGIVGDGINPIIEALRKREDRIRFIAVRHEEAAAFMASGYAKGDLFAAQRLEDYLRCR